MALLDSLSSICSRRDKAREVQPSAKRIAMNVRLLIVDDHVMVREGLHYALNSTEMETREAASGASALRIVAEEEVDAVLLDVDMPEMDGLEVLSQIKASKPDLPVLMHSCHDNADYVRRSIELKACGYVIKGVHRNELIAAIQIALSGGNVWTGDQLHMR